MPSKQAIQSMAILLILALVVLPVLLACFDKKHELREEYRCKCSQGCGSGSSFLS